MDSTVIDNPIFQASPISNRHEECLLNLHALTMAGKNETEEAEVIRDEMETLWRSLSNEERQFQLGLSADLYMVEGQEVYESNQFNAEQLREQLKNAWRNNDAETMLKLLRFGSGGLERYQVAYFRWKNYIQLGHLRAALEFINCAVKANPSEGFLKLQQIDTLHKLGNYHQAFKLGIEFLSPSVLEKEEFILMASRLVEISWQHFRNEHRQLCEQIKGDLKQVCSTLKSSREFFELAWLVLGHCYRVCGNTFLASDALANYRAISSKATGNDNDESQVAEIAKQYEFCREKNEPVISPAA